MTVLAGTGHQDIPRSADQHVRRRIEEIVGAFKDPITAATSLAAGADQLIAEAVARHGGALHVVVPSRGYDATFDATAAARYRALLASAAEVETLDYDQPSEAAFLAAGKRVVDISDQVLAVWDGEPAQGRGGTADIVAYARDIGKPVDIVWPEGVSR